MYNHILLIVLDETGLDSQLIGGRNVNGKERLKLSVGITAKMLLEVPSTKESLIAPVYHINAVCDSRKFCANFLLFNKASLQNQLTRQTLILSSPTDFSTETNENFLL